MLQYFLILLVGLLAGVLSGMFGIGGGAIIVPSLIIICGLSITEAAGTSLAALLLPVGILGVIVYHRSKLIDLRGAFIIAGGLIISSMLGAKIANSIDPNILTKLYGIFLFYVSWRFIRPEILYHQYITKKIPATSHEAKSEEYAEKAKWYWMLLLGLFAGILSGMFGIGGGAIIVPILIACMKYSAKRAIATSLGALLGPVGLPAALVYYSEGKIFLPYAAILACCLLCGVIFGAKLTIRLPEKQVKILFGIFLLIAAFKFIF